MANLHLVTGHSDSAHVTSTDHASLNTAIWGADGCVLNRGQKFATTVISNNLIRIADGDLVMQGRHVRLNTGSYVDVTIENGAQGKNRNDLIVCRYTKNDVSGIEECSLVVIKGTETTGTATDPGYIDGDTLYRDTEADFPLYRIPITGLNVGTPVQLFTVCEAVNAKAEEAYSLANEASQAAEAAQERADQAYSRATSSSGMIREFTSGDINVTTYTTKTNVSKLYMLTLHGTSGYISYTVDWRDVYDNSRRLYYVPGLGTTLSVLIGSSGNTTFSVPADTGAYIAHICGYY